MPATGTLTIKELRFVETYMTNGFNGAAAYRHAYKTQNSNVAKVEAYKMLRKPKIVRAIDENEENYRQIARQLKLSRKDVVKQLKNIIYGNEQKHILTAITILCRLLGDFSADKIEVTKSNIDSYADISKMTPDEREEYKQKLLAAM